MRTFIANVLAWLVVLQVLGGERENRHLKEAVLPQVAEFITRNGLVVDLPLTTNQVSHFKVDFGEGAVAATSHLRLSNRYNFHLQSSSTNSEVRSFYDAKVKTYYDLSAVEPNKLEAVRALNQRNKLSEKNARELLLDYFRKQGHGEGNFQAMEFSQMSWGKKGDGDYVPLPFYVGEWYRKDVKSIDRERGAVALPSIRIEVSGIDTQMIRYSKTFMPIGRDF